MNLPQETRPHILIVMTDDPGVVRGGLLRHRRRAHTITA